MKSHSNPASCMMTRRVASWFWCVAAVIPVAASTSVADVINVPQDHLTIQAAIDAAVGGDEVVVARGTYLEAIDFLGKAIWLHSADGPEVTTIDGTGNLHVVTCVSGEGPDSILEGFTITGGNANGSPPDDRGGGMRNIGSSPTVTNCAFTGNAANVGGGMYNNNGSPTVTDCSFSGNAADAPGGGMANVASNPTVTNCTFIDNSAAFFGGGMHNNNNSSAVILNCRFEGNTANRGGGMFNGGSSPTVTNCIFDGNMANDEGGGMWNVGSSPTVTNCTFYGNAATVAGALTSTESGSGVPSHPTLHNCVLWGDTPEEILEDEGSEAIVLFSNVQGGWAGTGNIDSDPLFVDPDNGDLRLLPGSPCIDAGDNAAVPFDIITDLDANPRFAHDPCTANTGDAGGANPPVDMGAYEFQPSCPADLDCNGGVDVGDLIAIVSAWGSCEGCVEDLNGDGAVAVGDLVIIIATWGPCP